MTDQEVLASALRAGDHKLITATFEKLARQEIRQKLTPLDSQQLSEAWKVALQFITQCHTRGDRCGERRSRMIFDEVVAEQKRRK